MRELVVEELDIPDNQFIQFCKQSSSSLENRNSEFKDQYWMPLKLLKQIGHILIFFFFLFLG